jgi:pimeloyl-ACP methyl ester carboxylesterase
MLDGSKWSKRPLERVGEHNAVEWAADFPSGVRVERIHGAGHFVHQERPDEGNRLLLDWMKNEPAGA